MPKFIKNELKSDSESNSDLGLDDKKLTTKKKILIMIMIQNQKLSQNLMIN